MTFSEAVKDVDLSIPGNYDIGFNGNNETEFDLYYTTDTENYDDLRECWNDFCYENDFEPDSIDYVYLRNVIIP